MSNTPGGYKEPRLDRATTKMLVEPIVGETNANVEQGNYIEQKARIFDGDTYRLLGQIAFLEGLGCDKEELGKIRIALMSPTIGFCSEIPEYGMRGEAIQVLTLTELPKKEVQTNTKSGIIRRGTPREEASIE